MQINSDRPIATPPTKCVNCGAEERRLLHHCRHSGVFRRLCTNCVLRNNPQSFCPTCFQVYPPGHSNDPMILCCKCYSTSHPHCVQSPYQTPYVCPVCANPKTPIFLLKPPREDNVDISGSEEWRVMDRDAAKRLLAAAKIAANTMTKAAVAAKAEAEKKAREAAIARKRAREALEHVRNLAEKEKVRKREYNGGFAYGVNRNGSVGGSNGTGPSIVENVTRVESSNPMNGVEFMGNKVGGQSAGNVDFGGNVDEDEDVVVMDVDVDVDDSGVGGSGVANGDNAAEDRMENGEEPHANGRH